MPTRRVAILLLLSMGCTLVFACIYVTANLIVDILYTFLDPRIRYDRKAE